MYSCAKCFAFSFTRAWGRPRAQTIYHVSPRCMTAIWPVNWPKPHGGNFGQKLGQFKDGGQKYQNISKKMFHLSICVRSFFNMLFPIPDKNITDIFYSCFSSFLDIFFSAVNTIRIFLDFPPPRLSLLAMFLFSPLSFVLFAQRKSSGNPPQNPTNQLSKKWPKAILAPATSHPLQLEPSRQLF